jgi:cell division protease FtsH
MSLVESDKITDVAIFPGKPDVQFLQQDGVPDTAKVFINDTFLQTLRDHHVNVLITDPPATLGDLVANGFMTIAAFALVSLLISRVRQGGGMGGGRSLTPPGLGNKFELIKEVDTRFGDVAGIDQELQEVKEIVDFLKTPEVFMEAGARIPTGCLLCGPPGTGKTLLARAIAGEAGVPFIATSASEFVELFVGLGASRVRQLFDLARKNAPCIIFVDELDALAKVRSANPVGNNNDEREQTLNQLLTELDGFNQDDGGIIMLGATNRPDTIDPAVLRPGRFDRRVEVGLPGLESRSKILGVHAKNKKLAEGISLKDLAQLTPGFNGAELQALMNESAIYAARRGESVIRQDDVDNAYEKVTLGLPKTGEVSDDRNELVAYHEAGHAIMGVLCKQRVGKVTIIPRGNAGGFTQFIPDEENDLPTREAMLGRIRVAMGGRAAEEIIYGKTLITSGAQGDLQQATQLAYQMVEQFGFGASVGPMAVVDDCSQAQKALVDEEIQSLLSGVYQDVVQDLWCFRDQLEVMKDLLVSHGTLRGDVVQELVMKAVPLE